MPEYRKKLIEVALPLEAINKESAREKSIRHGHPSTLHMWWARRPLAACRAVLFAQMVDDPSSLPEEFPTEEVQEVERQRLFRIIEEFVKWENITNEAVLHKARVEIARSAARNHGISLPHSMTPAEVADALERYAPPALDPFAGGGSIPLEAQRLGLEAHASDLNPVSVLINKALIEIPPKFAGRPPMNPEMRKTLLQREWKSAQGLAEDVRHYGRWMRNEAFKSIGHLYPKVQLPKEYGGGEATVIAWLWARTVTCPNPACRIQTPLLSSFILSSKKGRETYLVPKVFDSHVNFSVSSTPPQNYQNPNKGLKRGISGIFECISCGTTTTRDYVSKEAKAKRLGLMPTAVVVEGRNGRIYLSPDYAPLKKSLPRVDTTGLDAELSPNPRDVWCRNFGLDTPVDLFTPRQLVALTTFSDLIQESRKKVLSDASIAGLPIDGVSLNDGGTGAKAYADAVATYLALAVDKGANLWSSLCSWMSDRGALRETFARQAIPMIWDFAEANPFSDSGGNVGMFIDRIVDTIEYLPSTVQGVCKQRDATTTMNGISNPFISTDPPYYNNIGYADLSDFFYVWLRRSLNKVYPDLFGTMLVPKAQELVATPHRFGGSKIKAQQFFEKGLSKAFMHMRAIQYPNYPLTVYYAFKQSESDADDINSDNNGSSAAIASTGWESMLEGLIRAGFSITGTWPIRTESAGRALAQGTNVLASSIVLVCRPRPVDAAPTSRRDFLNALKRELPKALKDLQRGNIAPVDLAQAAIGPGMAVFSRYSKVLESEGTPMRIRTALQLINQTLDEVLAEQEGEYDADTRWAVAWFEQHGMEDGPYGVAETLSKAKNTAVGALVEAGILRAQGGKVRLLHRNEFSSDWNPTKAKRLTAWEVTQRLIRALQEHGDAGAASILDHVGAYGEVTRDLAYRLYTICERKKWADEALAYNSLVVEWSDISGAVEQRRRTTAEQARLFS